MLSARKTQPQPQPQPQQANNQDWLELLIQYTAALNPRGARQLIYRHGYNPSHTANLPAFLLEFLRQGGEPALDEFLSIHPDRDLILDSLPTPTLSAASATPQVGLLAFTGRATQAVGTNLATQLAELINKQKMAVVDVLNRHGAAVLYDDPAQVVSRAAVKALQVDNPVMVRELGALTASATTFSASYEEARTSGQLAPAASLLGDVDVSLAEDNAAIARAKLRLGLAVAAVVLLLVAVGVYVHVKSKRA